MDFTNITSPGAAASTGLLITAGVSSPLGFFLLTHDRSKGIFFFFFGKVFWAIFCAQRCPEGEFLQHLCSELAPTFG